MKLIKVVYIKKLTDALLKFIEDDFNSHINEFDSWLYRMLYDASDDSDFNFYKQAKDVFLGTSTSPRKIQTTLGYNKNTNGSPTITIREATKPKGSYNGIGGISNYGYLNDDNNYGVHQYRDTRKSDFELMVVTNNSLLTILISDVLYALFIGAWETVSYQFDTFDIVIKDMMVNQDVNAPLFIKSVGLSCQYENIVPSIVLDPSVRVNQIMFKQSSINNIGIQDEQ